VRARLNREVSGEEVEDMSHKNIEVTVLRFDPAVDREPYPQTYQVPLTEGMSVLEVLDYIYRNVDGSLAYYDHAACQHGICRRCTVVINGRPSLMCQTLVEGDITVEPPPRLEVVRDLVYRRRGDSHDA
jgi:succinate dehydrogenase/fumarate reductase-like Fe-S protein